MRSTFVSACLFLVTAACGGSAPMAFARGAASASPQAPIALDGAPKPAMASMDAPPASVAAYPAAAAPRGSAPSSGGGAPSGVAARSTAAAPPAARGAKSADPSAEASRAATIIYTGELQLAVDEGAVASTIDRAIDVAESLGGHLGARRDASVQVRVPSARFREALAQIGALGDVTHRAVSATDVTEEYHDAEVRLQNLRATRARLQEFLARAANVNDALAVERELERVAQEIDVLEGRIAFLASRAAFSQIDVAVAARPRAIAVVRPPPPRRYVELPVAWMGALGVDRLTTFEGK